MFKQTLYWSDMEYQARRRGYTIADNAKFKVGETVFYQGQSACVMGFELELDQYTAGYTVLYRIRLPVNASFSQELTVNYGALRTQAQPVDIMKGVL